MSFSGRKRMEYALGFKEADRIPMEIWIPENLMNYKGAQNLIKLVDEYCDRFMGIDVVNQGFFGVEAEHETKLIGEDKVYTYTENIYKTENGEFSQIVQRDKVNTQYNHFKKQYFSSEEDLRRFADCEFPDYEVPENYNELLETACKDKYMPVTGIIHPFGMLARNSPPEKFYMWLYTEKNTIHKIMNKMYKQINNFIEKIKLPYVFYFCSLEMAIEPWLSREMFDEYIFQYDVVMNKIIHRYGGLVKHHAHGPVFKHLEHWSKMGIDSLEPMEIAPLGDTVLKEAKNLMGKRMSFGGNIPSQRFVDISKYEIEKYVVDAIDSCAEGGGFILKGASSVCGLNSFKTYEQLDRIIEATEYFIKCGLKYGSY